MDKSTQLKTTGTIYQVIRAVVYLVSAWQLKKSGGHPDDAVIDWLTQLILPIVAPIAAFVWGQYQLHHRTDSAALKIDTALELPAGTNNGQLNAVVEKVKEIQSRVPELPLDAVVSSAAEGITK